MARVVQWILHIVLVLAVVVLLFWVNQVFDLERVLRSPWRPLNCVWLPLLFLVAYALGWLGWGLLRIAGPGAGGRRFSRRGARPGRRRNGPDGRRASSRPRRRCSSCWDGRPDRSRTCSAPPSLTLQVRNIPGNPEAPLHVFAGRSGIFVTCEGASLLGASRRCSTPAPAATGVAETGSPRELAEGTADDRRRPNGDGRPRPGPSRRSGRRRRLRKAGRIGKLRPPPHPCCWRRKATRPYKSGATACCCSATPATWNGRRPG